MIAQTFSIKDSKANAYLQAFYSTNNGTAIRQIKSALEDPNHQFSRFAEDFTLFHIGSFDDETAIHVNLDAHENLGNLSSLKAMVDSHER